MTQSTISRRAGLMLPALERCLWVVASRAAEIEAVYPALDEAVTRRPGYLLVLSTPAGRDLDSLAIRYEREIVLPLPFGWALKRFTRSLGPKLVVLLGSKEPWRTNMLCMLRARGLAVASFDDPERPTAEALAACLPPVADNRGSRESLRRPRRLARFVRGPIGRHAVEAFSAQRIGSWDELRQLLGRPRTIVCLGNGPSSEEPALARIASDALLRVNWRWRERGFLASPQLVFIGDPRTPNRLPTGIFGFRSREDANYVLLRQCLSLHLPRFRFFVFDDLPSPVADPSPAARPTNGAIMIAAAVALRPERLVIAGVDLYQHPLGRYPGGTGVVDGYNRVHDRNVEIAFISQALQGHSGDLSILSPTLNAALPMRRR
jgi:3-Deoxy-D-manno-octulosonic-acid transferase (kdotransferase)